MIIDVRTPWLILDYADVSRGHFSDIEVDFAVSA